MTSRWALTALAATAATTGGILTATPAVAGGQSSMANGHGSMTRDGRSTRVALRAARLA
ncbi:hypothetical protein [Streptomyces sp. NPDC046887]|uniref:hypothetical protein n=1 Tax=Streptomyces sp. NPDC046887 TaxID=3155472 RepID=UPI0033EB2DF4